MRQADEYDGCFLGLSPYIAVITNVEWEHVDIFQDEVCDSLSNNYGQQQFCCDTVDNWA